MWSRLKILVTPVVIGCLCAPTMAKKQNDDSHKDLDLASLLNLTVEVASKSAIPLRETPGIVTVITEEEIRKSGAVDLMEVLNTVPGFGSVQDVSGATGISLRGNMGYIGRIAVLIDGQETNELSYSCTFTDNHYPVDNIKRIEIIRGPGSAIYGGYAELGVISIITKSGADLEGFSVSGNYGQMADAMAHLNINTSIGHSIGEEGKFSFSSFASMANRSDQMNPDFYGKGTYDMSDNSDITSFNLNGNFQYKGFETRLIYDNYNTVHRSQYDVNLKNAYDSRFQNILGEIKYGAKLSEKVTLTPKYNAVFSTPWQLTDSIHTVDKNMIYNDDVTTFRNKIGLTAGLNLMDEKLNIFVGGEYTNDYSIDPIYSFSNGESEIMYHNGAGYAQGILNTNLMNITLGIRADYHSVFGLGLAPRVGITKVFDRTHIKLLASQAFRSPSLFEINAAFDTQANGDPHITPEVAKVLEAELGVRLTPTMSLVGNIFYSQIDSSIVYSTEYDDEDNVVEGYRNNGTSGTWGLETEYKLKGNWGFLNLNYSYYSAKGINEVEYYKINDWSGEGSNVDGNAIESDITAKQLVGTSPHKISLNSTFKLIKGLSISPSYTWFSKKYAYTNSSSDFEYSVPNELHAQSIANLYATYDFPKGFAITAGVSNIFDEKQSFVQAYDGWNRPLPGEGRRASVKVVYDFRM